LTLEAFPVRLGGVSSVFFFGVGVASLMENRFFGSYFCDRFFGRDSYIGGFLQYAYLAVVGAAKFANLSVV
jgi:hypothetical protein